MYCRFKQKEMVTSVALAGVSADVVIPAVANVLGDIGFVILLVSIIIVVGVSLLLASLLLISSWLLMASQEFPESMKL